MRHDQAKILNLSTVLEMGANEPDGKLLNSSSQIKLVSFEHDCDDIESILSLKPDKFSDDSE